MTITEFLLARIAEDEAAARDAHYVGQPWMPEEEAVVRAADWEPIHYADRKRDALHIARHDPARVLAQCVAMRKIVELGSQYTQQGDALDHGFVGGANFVAVNTIRAFASIWSDHPDYQQEWA